MNKYNSEHYPDPTVYEALTNMERATRIHSFRPLVFICSPYTGNIKRNVHRAQEYSRFAVSQNTIPIAPHLLFPQFLDDGDSDQRSLGIFMGLVLMGKCHEVWVFGTQITRGMALEIEKARERGKPIRYFSDQCEEGQPCAK